MHACLVPALSPLASVACLFSLLPALPQNLSLIVVGLGALFSLLFHMGTKEKKHPQARPPDPEEHTPLLHGGGRTPPRPFMLWKHWLLEPAFYQVLGTRARELHES